MYRPAKIKATVNCIKTLNSKLLMLIYSMMESKSNDCEVVFSDEFLAFVDVVLASAPVRECTAPPDTAEWNHRLPENRGVPLCSSGQHNRRATCFYSILFNVGVSFYQRWNTISNHGYRDSLSYFTNHVNMNWIPGPLVLLSVENQGRKWTTNEKPLVIEDLPGFWGTKIGRASCRERV